MRSTDVVDAQASKTSRAEPSDRGTLGVVRGQGEASVLLRTKLHRPPVTPDALLRPDLVARLEGFRSRPLTLIAAPAGYGKSTLASLWLEASDAPSAWLSLDEGDSDLRTFFEYLVAAIRTIVPDACRDSTALLGAPHFPSAPVLSSHLLNDLETIGERFTLVLDDYHKIRASSVHDLVSSLLAHPSPRMHLVLLTRRDPPLPVSMLRGRGAVTEITIDELGFTSEETGRFLGSVLAGDLDEQTTAAISDKFEGWPAGIRLMADSLRHRPDAARFLAGLEGGFAAIVEYLVVEVLSRESPAVVAQLVGASILDRFCAPLCEALFGPHEEADTSDLKGAEFIAALQQRNLFLIPLDTEHQWFRFHHLFQQVLRDRSHQQVSEGDLARLHCRASAWFAAHGSIEEAIKHALAGGDETAAAEIVAGNVLRALDLERQPQVMRWLDQLPDDSKWNRVEILLAEAWIGISRFGFADVPTLLERIRELGGRDEPALHFLEGTTSFWRGDAEHSLTLLEEALRTLPENSSSWVRSEAELYYGLALCVTGQSERALRFFDERLGDESIRYGMLWTRLQYGRAVVPLLSGALLDASGEARQLQAGARRADNVYAEGWAVYVSGNAYLHSYDLRRARDCFRRVVEERYVHFPRIAADAMAGLALACQLAGESDEAQEAVRELVEFAESIDDPRVLAIAESCRARVALLQGDLDSVADARWFCTESDVPGMFFFLENPCVTGCRLLIASGSDVTLAQAAQTLRQLREATSTLHFVGQTIEIVVLQAWLLEKQGQHAEALDALRQAVAMAEPGGWVRPFAEVGAPIADLLARLVEQDGSSDFTSRLLDAVDRGGQSGPSQGHAGLAIRAPSPGQRALVEPLTNREMDVLELLRGRFQNKEIAVKLSISTETVKTHVQNVCQKLGASNRREAVTRASDLGVLDRL